MRIGVVRERGPSENRVGLTPAGARSLAGAGHEILIEARAGAGARFSDGEYLEAGAMIAYDPTEVFGRSDLLLKVAALTPSEVPLVREEQVVLAFHHLATKRREFLKSLIDTGATFIGYEVIEDAAGDLPVLRAMSEIAGKLVVHVAAHCLETGVGGRGVLLGGAAGIPPAHVVILGGGVVGLQAARTASGAGAQVTLLDSSLAALRRAEETLGRGVVTEAAHPASVERAVGFADVLVGAVLVRGERAPHVVSRPMVQRMKPGAVILDVSIDQGGCVETSRPTTIESPIFIEGGVVHYCVPNMTTVVARTASLALTYATLPHALTLAGRGVDAALRESPGLAAGACIHRGELVSDGAARACGLTAAPLGERARRTAGARPVEEVRR